LAFLMEIVRVLSSPRGEHVSSPLIAFLIQRWTIDITTSKSNIANSAERGLASTRACHSGLKASIERPSAAGAANRRTT